MDTFFMEDWVVVGCNEHVIHIDDEPSFSKFFFKDGIHHHLKHGWGVSHSEEHNGRFEQSFIGDECSFPLISVLYSDIIVSPTDIEFSEQGLASCLVNELWDEWQGVGILDCPLI